MNKAAIRSLCLLALVASLTVRVQANQVRTAMLTDFDIGAAVTRVIREHGYALRENPVKPPKLLADAVYFQRPECDQPSFVLPYLISAETLPMLTRLNKPEYGRSYFYMDRSWNEQRRVAMILQMGEVYGSRYCRRVTLRPVQEGDHSGGTSGLRLSCGDRLAACVGKRPISQGDDRRDRATRRYLNIMDALIREHAWFLTFWGVLALLGTLEVVFPQVNDFADRARRWPTNFGLGIVNSLVVSSLPILAVASAQWAENHGIGLLNWLAAPWWIAVPCTLLVRSLAFYALHVTSHKVPLLWRLHRVHHLRCASRRVLRAACPSAGTGDQSLVHASNCHDVRSLAGRAGGL